MDQHYRQALSQYIGQDIHLRTSLIYHVNPSFVVSTSWWRATTRILTNHSDSNQDLLVPFLTTLDHMTYRALGRHIEPPWYLEQSAILLHHLLLVTALTHCSTHKRHPLPQGFDLLIPLTFKRTLKGIFRKQSFLQCRSSSDNARIGHEEYIPLSLISSCSI